MQQYRQDIAHHQGQHGKHRRPPQQHRQHFRNQAFGSGAGACAEGGHPDHHQDDDDVLNDQEADRDPAMQGIDFLFVGQQLDDDDGAREGQRDAGIKRRNRGHAQRQGEHETEHRCEQHLPQPGRQCHRPHRAYDLQIQLEADHEKQQRYAHLGQQFDRLFEDNPAEYRWTENDTGRNKGDHQRLAGKAGKRPDQGHNGQHGRQFDKGVVRDRHKKRAVSLSVAARETATVVGPSY